MAKNNVLKNYPVVGVLDMFNMTLRVLERKLPQFFDNAFELYFNDPQFRSNKFRNVDYKKPVSEKIKSMVRKNLTNELEFYDFCKQRLQSQYNSIISKSYRMH